MMGPVFAWFVVSEDVPVALNLFPKLFPERVFYCWGRHSGATDAPDAARISGGAAAYACRDEETCPRPPTE